MVAAVAAADPSLPGAVIEAAVDAVAPGGQALRQLADALAADPAALTAGAPPVAGRLAAELIARGSATLAIPACAVCGRAGKPLFRGDGGGVCQRCRAWQLARPCATCGKAKPAAGHDEHGRAVCEVCRRRDDPRRHRECGTCGKTAPVAVRGRDGQPDICVNCYRLPEATCSRCQRRRPCSLRGDQPAGLPARARRGPPPPARAAGRTARRRPAGRRDRSATRVTRAALRHRGPCAPCGQQRRLVAPPGPAADTCADCAGIPVISACTDCGTEDKLYEKGRCARCSLRRRARELLSAGTGTIAAQLSGVLDAVTAARQPRSALNWLRKGAGAGLLADVAAGRLAISHEALDAYPHRRAADYLRHMLTAAGALPARDEELARTGQWLAAILEAIEPAADRRLVQAYATWQVMRRLRASAAAAARPRTPTAHARNHIRAAASLLAWLRGRGTDARPPAGRPTSTNGCAPGPSACLARDFLAWAAVPRPLPAADASPRRRARPAPPSARTSGGR